MYANLSRCLQSKGIAVNAAAKVLGMSEPTFRMKLTERHFSVDDAFRVQDELFPEYDIRYLFKRDDEARNEE